MQLGVYSGLHHLKLEGLSRRRSLSYRQDVLILYDRRTDGVEGRGMRQTVTRRQRKVLRSRQLVAGRLDLTEDSCY